MGYLKIIQGDTQVMRYEIFKGYLKGYIELTCEASYGFFGQGIFRGYLEGYQRFIHKTKEGYIIEPT